MYQLIRTVFLKKKNILIYFLFKKKFESSPIIKIYNFFNSLIIHKMNKKFIIVLEIYFDIRRNNMGW